MSRKTMTAVFALTALTSGLWAGNARADLVMNGNFATGDFTDWIVSDQGETVDSVNPASGDAYDASLGSLGGPGVLHQSIATIYGTTYTVSFNLANGDMSGGTTDLFTVQLGSGTKHDFSDVTPGLSYTFESFQQTVMSNAPTSDLVFSEENDSSAYYLDDVSVIPFTPVIPSIPEPSSALLVLTAATLGLGVLRLSRNS